MAASTKTHADRTLYTHSIHFQTIFFCCAPFKLVAFCTEKYRPAEMAQGTCTPLFHADNYNGRTRGPQASRQKRTNNSQKRTRDFFFLNFNPKVALPSRPQEVE